MGETPTGGINRKQFKSALRFAEQFTHAKATGRQPLNILGPSFSGSLYSLEQLIEKEASSFSPITIASGGVSGEKSVEEFRASTENYLRKSKLPQVVNFASFLQISMAMELALLQYACDQWRLWPRDVTVLSETETAFGRKQYGPMDVCRNHNLTTAESTPLALSYPRGIYHIRSAYEQQYPDGKVQGDDRPQFRNNLRPNLEEKRTAADSVANYSKQSAVSQEAALMGVVDKLQKHDSQLVVLTASDPLDMLFLVRYLRKNYAYGRLVIIGPDLLLRHEAEDPAVLGVMAIASYSLSPGSWDNTVHAWSEAASDSIFSDDSSIATYNATRSIAYCLLHPREGWCERGMDSDPSAALLPADLELVDYGPSHFAATCTQSAPGACCRPEIHLDVLGRGGFWPVASLQPLTSSPSPATADFRRNRR